MTKLVRTMTAIALIPILITGLVTPAQAGEVRQRGMSAVFTQMYNDDSFKANSPQTPYNRFNIVYVGFAHVNPRTNKLGFQVQEGAGIVAQQQKRLRNIQKLTAPLRRAGKLKLVVSLGFGKKFNDIPKIERHLKTFAPSVRSFLKKNKFDGFDIDYEKPHFSSVRQFTRVSKTIRQSLGKRYLFTISPNNTKRLRGPILSKYYDYVNVQSYVAPNDAPMPVRDFVRMPGMDRSKLLAGADTEAGDKISRAIKDYRRYQLDGVFAWQLKPNFNQIANQMWRATR